MVNPHQERSQKSRPALRLINTRNIERADWLQVRKQALAARIPLPPSGHRPIPGRDCRYGIAPATC